MVEHAPPNRVWSSDAIVTQLSRLNLSYVALVPGYSFRGLHDSLVNYNGDQNPEIILCLHEEHCVAIAHGFAKVAERPMAAAVHDSVGLMHATMAIYNAFCDRVPVVVLGGVGPLDAAKRRPWIDWIHTAADEAALIRHFIKFDDQPASVQAAIYSVITAAAAASQMPRGPTFVCLDVTLQETLVEDPAALHFPTTQRYLHEATPPGPSAEDVERIRVTLHTSQRPLFLMGRVNRSQKSWHERVQLAERYHARVLTDLRVGAAFPTQHVLHASPPELFLSPQESEVIRSADTIVSFDWVDLAGTLQTAYGAGTEPRAYIVDVSLDSTLRGGWSKDHFGQPPIDLAVRADVDATVSALLAASLPTELQPDGGRHLERQQGLSDITKQMDGEVNQQPRHQQPGDTKIYMKDLAEALYGAINPDKTCLIRLPLGWRGRDLRATHSLAYLGQDGGEGTGSGPGMAVGAALALKDTEFLPVAILGDGDFLMGSSALWTAARYRVPLLVIIANNASFYNDEEHQEDIARERGRPTRNKGVGTRIDDPLPDISQNAASLGAKVLGPQVTQRAKLLVTLREATRLVQGEKVLVVVDVQVCPDEESEKDE
ncbi:thiamine pyrophosphate protein TPP binding domain protein [Phialemonium atrogriseum]|uniref:Thiamine pyrophosphate protein TPP binding domain protein n=1 Tax=Phialemonium atrogriseum TaxID=1093897 RepID=A0AAJ0BVZ7_9PEZI|nr:thiamine pyrophosphate protein TPP binding domain protein [Phialemonium atrogriseum]KAK1765271.1 thiamine pyrophosphate protein TPP binding domain protein [Phialemonium atrogriseum]